MCLYAGASETGCRDGDSTNLIEIDGWMKTLHFESLPGSVAHENQRVMRVRQAQEGMRLIEFLHDHHPPTPHESWLKWLAAGDIARDGLARDGSEVVVAGQRYIHTMHGVLEPDVASRISIVHEDEAILVVDKPAPLPVHPSGRFHRNTLLKLLETAFPGEKLRVVHRLDANTTGLVVLAKTAGAARCLNEQFVERQVQKQYIARVDGHVPWDQHLCRVPIANPADHSPSRNTIGSRVADSQGLPAETGFRVIDREQGGTTLLHAWPLTGRTNQIRVHLWSLGFPIVGDLLYLSDERLGQQQTLRMDQPPMCLHAERLRFTHPVTGRDVCFESQSPTWLVTS